MIFALPFLFIIAIARRFNLGDWDDIIIFLTLIGFIILRALFQP
jgi:hypothetical protein